MTPQPFPKGPRALHRATQHWEMGQPDSSRPLDTGPNSTQVWETQSTLSLQPPQDPCWRF